jgi:pyruvate ferredoxin oxidoreductase alpha subunit
MDGFILTHAYERVDMPTQQQVDAYLPPFSPRQVLDPNEPVSMGAMVGPEAFTEVRYLAHAKQMEALELIPGWAAEFRRAFGREAGGLVRGYRLDDAETVVIALGSVLGTVKDTVDEMRARGHRIGVLGISCFRPWPLAAVRAALEGARRVVVLEKSLAVGVGGIVSTNVRTALTARATPVYDVVCGLGGRPITKASLSRVFVAAMKDELDLTTFLDLDRPLVEKVLAREKELRRSGPRAEQVLKEKHGLPAR